MRTFTFTTLLVITTFCYSQENEVILKINAIDSMTTNCLEFKGTITNNSSESKKIRPHGSDCKSNVYPYLWEIQIKHNGLNYQNPFQIVVLGFSYVRGNFVKIKKKKKYEFSFSIDFSKIGLVSKVYKFENYVSTVNKDSINEYYFNGKNNFKNFDYGEYSVKLLYKAIMKDKQTINSLESNIVNIEYRE